MKRGRRRARAGVGGERGSGSHQKEDVGAEFPRAFLLKPKPEPSSAPNAGRRRPELATSLFWTSEIRGVVVTLTSPTGSSSWSVGRRCFSCCAATPLRHLAKSSLFQ